MKISHSAILFAATASTASAFAPAQTSFRASTRSASAVVADAETAAPVAEEPKEESKPTPAAASAPATAFAGIQPGRYSEQDMSVALPFLRRPNKLDGTHAGDHGFDPLGFTEEYDLYTMMEAEIRHARLAMLAVVGWPLSELVAPSWMLQDGCAPSVLNGFNPLSFLAVLGAFGGLGLFEYLTALRNTADTPMGKKHMEDMSAVWNYGVPGDYNWDPAGLYSILGDSAVARKGLRDVEISHGRMAMLGITSFAAWEKLTGHPIVENSMFFHPNLLLPALVAGYVAFTQIYEFESNDQYVLQIVKTSEGDARLENVKMSLRNMAAANAETAAAIGELAGKATEMAKKAKAAIDEQIPSEEGNQNGEDKDFFLK